MKGDRPESPTSGSRTGSGGGGPGAGVRGRSVGRKSPEGTSGAGGNTGAGWNSEWRPILTGTGLGRERPLAEKRTTGRRSSRGRKKVLDA